MNSKHLATLAVAAVMGVGAYWYGSPYLALYSLKSATDRNDAEALSAQIDYPSVRDSLKRQFSAMLTGQMTAATGAGNAERAGAAVGSMLALTFADKLIDSMVTPEMLMRAMKEGRVGQGGGTRQPANEGTASPTNKVSWTCSRPTMDRLVASARDDESGQTPGFAMVLDRHGFADWKVSELRLPLNMNK